MRLDNYLIETFAMAVSLQVSRRMGNDFMPTMWWHLACIFCQLPSRLFTPERVSLGTALGVAGSYLFFQRDIDRIDGELDSVRQEMVAPVMQPQVVKPMSVPSIRASWGCCSLASHSLGRAPATALSGREIYWGTAAP